MKKIVILTGILLLVLACNNTQTPHHLSHQKPVINKLLNQWHKDVATYNYTDYFDAMDEDMVFVGTDASERWTKKEFMKFSKPYFDSEKTWNFKPVKRNISIYENTAWFDEILDTWMGICRGSGVLVYKNNQWKITQYVLSVTVPNKVVTQVIQLKKAKDSMTIRKLKAMN